MKYSKNARSTAWRHGERAQNRDRIVSSHSITNGAEVALQIAKRGKVCTIAKLAIARPLGELALVMPYRNRQTVEHVSLPPSALAYAKKAGCHWWIVRLDEAGECYGMPLADVQKLGWLKTSEGRPEWFVKVSSFKAIAWQQWDFITPAVLLDDQSPAPDRQLGFGDMP